MATLPATVDVAAISDTGRVREHNEDAVWMGTEFFRSGVRSARFAQDAVNGLLLAVADGVGGAAAGEVASRWVSEQMAARMEGEALPDDPDELGRFFQSVAGRVNEDLENEAARRSGARGMATTYTGIVFTETASCWLNAGDSRLYEFQGDELHQISRDHTLREEMGDPSIPGNIITNCFGHQDGFRLDVGELDPAAPDLYLLCSDGLSDYADMDQVARVLRDLRSGVVGPAELEEFARMLLDLALAGGGGDNVTLLIARPTYE